MAQKLEVAKMTWPLRSRVSLRDFYYTTELAYGKVFLHAFPRLESGTRSPHFGLHLPLPEPLSGRC